MSALLQILPAQQQVQLTEQTVLTEIFRPEVNLAVWQRQLAPGLLQYTDELVATASSQFAPLQFVATPEELQPILEQRLPEGQGKALLIADLVLMAQMLTCLMDCPAVGFRLKVLEKPMCPRFHTDHIAVRLLVTYAGTATQWLNAPPAQQDTQHRTENIQQISIGDVALLKGSGWEHNEHGAIWHRSPACVSPRLLLSLDPVGE